MEHGQPSANGTLNDLASVATALRGWEERRQGNAGADTPAPEPDAPKAVEAEEPRERVEAEPVADESVAAEDAQPEAESEGAEGETDEEAVYEIELEDGKAERFTAAELRASVLRQRDYTRKTQELAEGRRIVEAKAVEVGNTLRALSERIQALDSQIKGEDTSAWEELRRSDPSEWSARMIERKARMDALAAGQQQYEAQMRQSRAESERREAEILREKIPAWKDGAVASREYGDLIRFAVDTYGLTPDVLENVASDHRFVLLARDAMQGREATRKADVVKQKVRKLPRVQQPGASGPAHGATKDVAYQRAMDRLKATGGRSPDDIAAAFRASAERHRR